MKLTVLTTRLMFALCACLSSVLVSGCDVVEDYVDKATFQASDDQKVIDVAIHFTPKVTFNYDKHYDIKTYGYAYVLPYEKDVRNFEAGLHILTTALADEEFATKRETSFLPNGLATGLPYPVVEVRGDEPVYPNFDIMGYFDLRQL